MKYENFEEAERLYLQIKKLKKQLEQVRSCPTVSIGLHGNTVFTVGTDAMCEHEHTEAAKLMVSRISNDIAQKIDDLEQRLMLL